MQTVWRNFKAEIEEAAEGQRRITHELPELVEGAGEMNTALEAVAQGMANMRSQLAQLTDGLGQSADGLGQIADGLKQMRGYAVEVPMPHPPRSEAGICPRRPFRTKHSSARSRILCPMIRMYHPAGHFRRKPV